MKLLKFYAPWCQPCKMLDRQLEDFELSIPKQAVNIDSEIDLAMQYKVRGIPTMIIIDEMGTEVKRVTGSQTDIQLTKFFME